VWEKLGFTFHGHAGDNSTEMNHVTNIRSFLSFADMIQLITRDNQSLNLFEDNALPPMLSGTDELDMELFGQEDKMSLTSFAHYQDDKTDIDCTQSINQASQEPSRLAMMSAQPGLNYTPLYNPYQPIQSNYIQTFPTSLHSYLTENAFSPVMVAPPPASPTVGISSSSLLPKILAQPSTIPCMGTNSAVDNQASNLVAGPPVVTVATPIHPAMAPVLNNTFRPALSLEHSVGSAMQPKIAISRFVFFLKNQKVE
jgi:hypothetical protein